MPNTHHKLHHDSKVASRFNFSIKIQIYNLGMELVLRVVLVVLLCHGLREGVVRAGGGRGGGLVLGAPAAA